MMCTALYSSIDSNIANNEISLEKEKGSCCAECTAAVVYNDRHGRKAEGGGQQEGTGSRQPNPVVLATKKSKKRNERKQATEGASEGR